MPFYLCPPASCGDTLPGLTTENLFLASSDDFPHQKCLRTVHDLGSKLLEEMAALKIIIHISVNSARNLTLFSFKDFSLVCGVSVSVCYGELKAAVCVMSDIARHLMSSSPLCGREPSGFYSKLFHRDVGIAHFRYLVC